GICTSHVVVVMVTCVPVCAIFVSNNVGAMTHCGSGDKKIRLPISTTPYCTSANVPDRSNAGASSAMKCNTTLALASPSATSTVTSAGSAGGSTAIEPWPFASSANVGGSCTTPAGLAVNVTVLDDNRRPSTTIVIGSGPPAI